MLTRLWLSMASLLQAHRQRRGVGVRKRGETALFWVPAELLVRGEGCLLSQLLCHLVWADKFSDGLWVFSK